MKIQSEDPGARRSALASSAADLRELRGNSRATVQELQAFLRELKGKSPHEMLGVVAASHLARSLVLSTGIVVGAILLFTAIPYFFGAKETPAPVEAGAPPVPVQPPPTPAPPEIPQAVPQPDPLAPLGVGEQLAAPPDKNPLENQGDDLLKDLE
jgi:hypothetical protein